MRVKRNELLSALQLIRPGLAGTKEGLEQSACVIFKEGEAISFNEEIFCRTKSGLDSKFEGAIRAKPLLDLLEEIKKEDELDLIQREGKATLKGKGHRTDLRMEVVDATFMQAIEGVDRPEKWLKLPDLFTDAIAMVRECAGKNKDYFASTCVHFTPNFVEAGDQTQVARYKLDLPCKEDFLIKEESVRHLLNFGASRFALSEGWVHFKNPEGSIISCMRDMDRYPDLSPYLQTKGGKKLTLPGAIIDRVKMAEIFSKENTDSNLVRVELSPGKAKIIGEGVTGRNTGWKNNIKYSGPELEFHVSPTLLITIITKYKNCLVSEDRLKVNGDNWEYLVCLSAPDKEDKDDESDSD